MSVAWNEHEESSNALLADEESAIVPSQMMAESAGRVFDWAPVWPPAPIVTDGLKNTSPNWTCEQSPPDAEVIDSVAAAGSEPAL